MTTTVLLATRVTELDPSSTLPRLLRQLSAGGVERVVVLARPTRAAALRAAGGDLVGTGQPVSAADLISAGTAGQPLRLADTRIDLYESVDSGQDLAALATVTGALPVVVLDADLIANDAMITSVLAGTGGGVTVWTSPVPDSEASSGSKAASVSEAASGRDVLPAGSGALVRIDRGRVISAASDFHVVADPTARSVGVFRIGSAQAASASAALARASVALVRAAAEDADQAVGASSAQAGTLLGQRVDLTGQSLDLALVAVVRSGIAVGASGIGSLVCRVVTDTAGVNRARAAIAGVDEDDARMRAAVKADDDLFATYAVSSWSPYLVRLSARLGLSPTTVTWLSVALALAAAVGFAHGGRVAAVGAGVLLYLSFVLDCVDGQLARYARRYSRFGGWLDTLADRGKEYAAYAGLAIGAARSDAGAVWPLAIAVLTLQAVRHMTDCWYGVARDEAVARLAPAPFDRAEDGRGGTTVGAKSGARSGLRRIVPALVAATNSGRRSVLHWVKKLMVFPIGERWMVIAIGGALFNAKVVFLAMLAWGGLAAIYVFSVRVLRTRTLRAPAMSTKDVPLHRDDGLLAELLGRLGRGVVLPLPAAALFGFAAVVVVMLTAIDPPGAIEPSGGLAAATGVAVAAGLLTALAGRDRHDGPLDWLLPAALRAAELLLIIGLAVRCSVPPPLLYGLLWVVAMLHYDLAARLDKAASPLRWRGLGLGWDGRLVVLGTAAIVGQPTLGFAILAGYLALVLMVGAGVGAYRAGGTKPQTAAVLTAPRQRSESPATVRR